VKEFSDLPTTDNWGIYDWQELIGRSRNASGALTDGVEVTLGMVYKVHAMRAVGDDGTEYAALVELQSGDWATVHAGCDFTGWGCQGDYVDWRIFISKNEAIHMGLTNESRGWLGLGLETVSEQS
jgi:hypothetical protein